MICTTGFLPWFLSISLKETDRLLSLRFLKNKLLANFPVTVLSTLCFECCRHGMHAICSWYVVMLFRSSVLQRLEQIERSIRFVGRGSVAPRLRFRRVVSTRRARGSLIIIIIHAFIVRSHWVRHDCHPTHLVNTLPNRSSARLSCPDPLIEPNNMAYNFIGRRSSPKRSRSKT